MMLQAVTLLGLVVNTTVVDKINDPMVDNGKINAPVIVRVVGGIDEGSAERFAQQMLDAQWGGQLVIPVVISSYGGSVYSLLKMMDIINKVKETTPCGYYSNGQSNV